MFKGFVSGLLSGLVLASAGFVVASVVTPLPERFATESPPAVRPPEAAASRPGAPPLLAPAEDAHPATGGGTAAEDVAAGPGETLPHAETEAAEVAPGIATEAPLPPAPTGGEDAAPATTGLASDPEAASEQPAARAGSGGVSGRGDPSAAGPPEQAAGGAQGGSSASDPPVPDAAGGSSAATADADAGPEAAPQFAAAAPDLSVPSAVPAAPARPAGEAALPLPDATHRLQAARDDARAEIAPAPPEPPPAVALALPNAPEAPARPLSDESATPLRPGGAGLRPEVLPLPARRPEAPVIASADAAPARAAELPAAPETPVVPALPAASAPQTAPEPPAAPEPSVVAVPPAVAVPPTEAAGDPSRNLRSERLPQIGQPPLVVLPAELSPDAIPGEIGPALLRNARPFDNPEKKPPFVILLRDTGNPALDLSAIAASDLPMTLIIDPASPDASGRAALWRAAGQEVALLSTALPKRATPSDVEVTLEALGAELPQALAVVEAGSGEEAIGRDLAGALVPGLKARGFGMVTWDAGLKQADQVARREGLPAARIFRDLDAKAEAAPVIRRYLDRAAFKAQQDGHVLVIGDLRPETLAAVHEWSLEGRVTGLALAPLSAVLTPLR